MDWRWALTALMGLGLTACAEGGPSPSGPTDAGARDTSLVELPVCGNGFLEASETCDDGNTTAGDGCSANCDREPRCGDGTVDDGEHCDDGNLVDRDGCAADCTVEAPCGNGVLDEGEACDDGNNDDGDGCAGDCTAEPRCGDGAVDEGEDCDDGNTAPGDGCDADCRVEEIAACGDGTVDDGEACDDGNNDPGDGCDANCEIEPPPPACGDGTVDDGEACDDGNTDAGDGCDPMCQTEPPPAVCGDGALDDGEACDDGNNNPGDGCAPDCTIEPRCGDGVVDDGEACDDGNNLPGDGCDPDCVVEPPPPACGDGALDDGEACDDGNNDPGDGCAADCTIEPFCGDGVVDPVEACDDGNNDPGDGCAADCTVEPFCGDGNLDPDEGCDDGNNDPDDGCAADCTVEPFCGDGAVGPDEECDDGNAAPGDGCDSDCRVEACGNGRIDAGEGCDDGNVAPGDGCSALCRAEGCGDGVLQPPEECDEGDLLDDDGCSALCRVEATDITGGGRFGGGFQAGSFDRFTFTLGALSTARLRTSDGGDGCPGDVDLVLFDADGAQIAFDAEAGCGTLELELAPGDYSLQARGGEGIGIPAYSLDAAFVLVIVEVCGDRRLADDEECDDGNVAAGDGCDGNCRVEAVDISAGGDFFGSFPARSLDRYRFTLPGPTEVELITSDGAGGCPGDTEMVLDTAAGLLIEAASDGAGGRCAAIGRRMDAGDYTLVVSGNGGVAVGAYFLTAVFRPVRAAGEGCDPRARLDVCGEGECRGEPALCRVGACGDGMQQLGEDCDDGNVVPGDGCDAACRIEACGNDRLDAGEECDDGNLENGDGCDAECATEAACGDGAVDPGEACDDGNLRDGDGCDRNCALEPACGDGRVDAGEECDDGNRANGDGCDRDCIEEPPPPRCGDGNRDPGEACDDGNLLDGDGCDRSCQLEPECGDGRLDPGEGCDDGNLQAGDGCDALCQVENAEPVCGDGAAGGLEQCDDGNLQNGDGCDDRCTFEDYDIIEAFSAFVGAVPANRNDVYRFTVESPAQLFAETGDGQGGCPAGSDTILTLFRDGAQVATNDDGGQGLCSLIDRAIVAGDYELRVTGFNAAAVPGYALRVQVTVDVSAGGDFAGGFVVGGDDAFLFDLLGDQEVTLTTSDGAGGCPGDTALVLFSVDDQGTLQEVVRVDGGGPGACAALVRDLNRGLYIAFVQGGAANAVAAYTLTAEFGACGDGVVGEGEECDDANRANGDGCDTLCTAEVYDLIVSDNTVNGGLPAGEADVFRFIVDDRSFFAALTTAPAGGCPGDTVIELFRIDGGRQQMALDNDGGEGGCSLLQIPALAAGTYELEVTADRALNLYRLQLFHGILIEQVGAFSGAFVPNGDDRFLFGLNNFLTITAEVGDGMGGCPGDTFMTLLAVDADGVRTPINANDDGGVGTCSRIEAFLFPGDYELVVVGFGANVDLSGGYTLDFAAE